MGVGGGVALLIGGVGGGGRSGLSSKPLASLAGVVNGEFSSIPGLGVVCWEDLGMLRCRGGSLLFLTWELFACTPFLHRLSNFCCSSCILLLFCVLDGRVGVATACICVGFMFFSASRALAGLNSTKVGMFSALKAGVHGV